MAPVDRRRQRATLGAMDVFITVHRSLDPIAAEIARDLLEEAGIAARLLGGGGDVLGGRLGESRVEVPAADAALAEQILASHADALATSEDEDDAAPGPEAPRPLRPLLAAGVAPICPGGGHFYARRPVVGGMILAGQVAALVALAVAGRRAANLAAVWALGLFLFDVVGAQLALRAENRGVRASSTRQATLGAVLLALVGGAAALSAPVLERIQTGRRGPMGRGAAEGWRTGPTRPSDLPFPLHLDLTR